jgi:hypothetical protein
MIVAVLDVGRLCILFEILDFLASPSFNLAPILIVTFAVVGGFTVPL